ncbi:MAG: hypothetical protein K2O99_08295 [Lachnospiraceae bacterium]|nr:hypothetical protein [Lachnospiraceae bacterium]MDE7030343.1 hypothetical protein [Lachnospiraceae bacterium]
MEQLHPVFGKLTETEFGDYEAVRRIPFAGTDVEVQVTFDGPVTDEHSRAYLALVENLDRITPDILQAVLEYQNAHYDDTDHTSSFAYFGSAQDVLENTVLYGIALQTRLFHIVTDSDRYREAVEDPQDTAQKQRCAVLLFDADWVNDDYRILSVALANEHVVYVTQGNISD